MTSSRIVSALARRDIHYGWVVVAVTFLTLLVTAGAMGMPGVMIVPLENEFGWSNAQISSALALRILLFGLFGPFAAALMNRFGVRRVIVSALALITAGLLISLMMTQVWQLVLLWGVVVGIGTGLTAMVLAATVATRWFNHRRGLVMGMLAASSATGQLLFLPVIAELTTHFGGRIASAHERRRSHLAFALAASYAARLRTGADFLGAVRDILCMWLQHQWPDSDALRCALPRLWTCRHRSSERARHDGCVRFCRHDWFGMAFRPLRQSLAPVLVLRSTWTVTALFAIHQFHALWAVALCGVLRPRLDRDRTANGEIDGRPLWPRTRRHGLWLDLHRPSDWRRKRSASRRRGPHGIPDLFAGILRRRCALHHRGDADSRCAEAVFTTDRHGNGAGLRPWRCLEGRKIVSRSA